MENKYAYFFGAFCMLFIMGCNEDAMNNKGINVKGCVTDNVTNMPIREARVTILCWYHAGWDKTDYISIDTVTDKNGCFSAKFEEGYKIVVAGVATKYYPNLKVSEELNNNNNIGFNLELSRRTDTIEANESKISLRYYIIQNSSD